MKPKRVILISRIALAIIFGYISSKAAFASTPVQNYVTTFRPGACAVPNRGLLVAQRGMLGERFRERERARAKEVEKELEKNPKLIDDPNYLSQHPKLARYIKNHPEAKQQIEQNPKAFFASMENRRNTSP